MRFTTTMLAASVSIFALCASAAAEDSAPGVTTEDMEAPSMVRVLPCSQLVRTNIVGIVGQPTIITFPKGEQIYRSPESGVFNKDGTLENTGWEGPDPKDVKDTPLGNNLPVWPAKVGVSIMTVITMTPDNVQKVYPFRMRAIANDSDALKNSNVTLNVFCGGKSTAPAAVPVPGAAPVGPRVAPVPGQVPVRNTPVRTVASWSTRQRTRRLEQQAAEEKLRTDSFNADQPCHYHAQGLRKNDITPRCPMDNGEWTLMRFPGLSKKPAVYVATGENAKDERLARQHESGDIVVLEEIGAHFRLRLGPSVLDIINDAYDPAGRPKESGTISPSVTRDLIQAQYRN